MHFDFIIRNCNPKDQQDARAYDQLNTMCAGTDAAVDTGSHLVFNRLIDRPNYKVNENLFLIEADGVIIGYINVLPEPGINRVVLEYRVSPVCDLETVFSRLLDYAIKRAIKLGAEKIHLTAPASDKVIAAIVSKTGFSKVRHYHELTLDVSTLTVKAIEQTGIDCRCYQAGEEELLVEIQNHSFADTWGYNPNTLEDIVWQFNVRNNRPGDVIFAWHATELVGFCWMGVDCGHDASTGKRKGRIYMIGVAPEYRDRRIGAKLLITGLLHLINEGQEIINLTVDSKNTKAIKLYRSMGFQSCGDTVWYEKLTG